MLLLAALCACSPLRGDNLLAVYTGLTAINDGPLLLESDTRDERLLFRNVSWEGRSFTPPLYWGVRYTRLLKKDGSLEIGIGAEFVHLKAYLQTERAVQGEGVWQGATPTLGDVIESFSISHGVDLLLANLVIKRGPILGQIGYGINISHFESTLTGFPHLEGTEFGGDAFQAGLGVHLPIWQSIYFFAGYRFSATTPTGAVSGGNEARPKLRVHHFDFGPLIRW